MNLPEMKRVLTASRSAPPLLALAALPALAEPLRDFLSESSLMHSDDDWDVDAPED